MSKPTLQLISATLIYARASVDTLSLAVAHRHGFSIQLTSLHYSSRLHARKQPHHLQMMIGAILANVLHLAYPLGTVHARERTGLQHARACS